MKFGSPEYLTAMQAATNADAEYQRLAKNETGSYTMILEAEPKKGVKDTIVIGYREEAGKILETWMGERPTDFTLSGAYGIWVDILRGKLGPTAALTMRKLKVRGNFLKLLAGSDATIRWLKVLQMIPTEFEGEYAQYNLSGSQRV